jgi:NADH-quinone oxidoreductase subunit C
VGLEEEAAPTDTDESSSALLAEFTAAIGASAVVESHIQRGDLWVRVRREDWKRAALTCRDMGFEYFCFLSGIDWMPSTAPNPKASVSDSIEGVEDEPEPEAPDEVVEDADGADGWRTGYAGGDTRFQVFARLYSVTRRRGITLKADLDESAPSVPSIIDIYPGADWSEREAAEMYGFDFVGHPNLVHLYLPGEFEGFPQRKDFPLLSREVKPWPGLVDVEPMPESGDGDADPADSPGGEEG